MIGNIFAKVSQTARNDKFIVQVSNTKRVVEEYLQCKREKSTFTGNFTNHMAINYYTPVNSRKAHREVTADEAVAAVRSHDHIHFNGGAQMPVALLDALCRRADESLEHKAQGQFDPRNDIEDIHLHHSVTFGRVHYADPKYEDIIFDQPTFVGGNVRELVNTGYADYIPVHLHDVPLLYRLGNIPCHVSFLSVSLPDEHGCVSLGTDVEGSLGALDASRVVIGLMNRYIPHTYGDARLPLGSFDFLVRDDRPLFEPESEWPDEVENTIGQLCADIIEDGSCLQAGIGSLPNAVVAHLKDHKDLGIHTEMCSDGLLELFRLGVATGIHKKTDPGKVVATLMLGSSRVFDYVDQNPDFLMMDSAYTNNSSVIGRNPKMVAINTAIQIDLTGQVCADSVGQRIISGTGGQLDFVKGTEISKGGKSIMAFASRTKKGQSKIVPILDPGAGVVTPRPDAHWVVSEYGAVDLSGKSLQERAKLLISIAHPDDRETLDRAAFERFGPHFKSIII